MIKNVNRKGIKKLIGKDNDMGKQPWYGGIQCFVDQHLAHRKMLREPFAQLIAEGWGPLHQ
jgi:hypothetical protein